MASATISERAPLEYVEFRRETLWLLMTGAGITPEILSYEVGVTEYTVWRWLAGVRRPHAAMWRAVQRYFDTY